MPPPALGQLPLRWTVPDLEPARPILFKPKLLHLSLMASMYTYDQSYQYPLDCELYLEVITIFGKRLIAASLALALVVCGAFAVGAVTTSSIVVNASAGTTPTQNITEMIDDITPSFVLLVFIMVFMLMLLSIVDRIGKH